MGHRCIETIVESFSTWKILLPRRTKEKGATFDMEPYPKRASWSWNFTYHLEYKESTLGIESVCWIFRNRFPLISNQLYLFLLFPWNNQNFKSRFKFERLFVEILENNFFPNLSILISNLVIDLKERKWNVIVAIFLLEINKYRSQQTYVCAYVSKGEEFFDS